MVKQVAKKTKHKVSVKKPNGHLHKSFRLRYSKASVIEVVFSRSKVRVKRRQIVWPLYFSTYKQVALRLVKARYKKRPPKTYTIVIQRRQIVAFVIFIIGVSGSIYFGLQLAKSRRPTVLTNQSVSIPTPEQQPAIVTAKSLVRSEPQRLEIPRIGIDVPVTAVGRQSDGTIETPKLFENIVGWYKYSPTPGELGPAVIVGHVDTYKGPSVFWKLEQLKVDDEIKVTRSDNTVAKFKITKVEQFEQSNFPTEEVYGNLDYPGLRLITCGGVYNHKTQKYSANTIVFAKLAE